MDRTDRVRNFALRLICVCAALPPNRTADVIGRQSFKAGTPPSAYLGEALRARSKAEYVAKLNGGLMEFGWLELADAAGFTTGKSAFCLRLSALIERVARKSATNKLPTLTVCAGNGGASSATAHLPSAFCFLP